MLTVAKLLMIVVAGRGVIDRGQVAIRQRLAVEAIVRSGGFVYYDFEFVDDKREKGRRPTTPQWLRELVGDDFFQDVVEVNFVTGESAEGKPFSVKAGSDDVIPRVLAFPHLKRLYIQKDEATDRAMDTVARLPDLEFLIMWNAKVTDAGIAKLKNLKKLKVIHVGNAGIGDDALKCLSKLPRLEIMAIQGNRFTDKGLGYLKDMKVLKWIYVGEGQTEISDAGMAHLKGLANLEILDIRNTNVTDEGLKYLAGLKKLNQLWISETQITNDGVEQLQKSLPKLKVNN